MVSVAVNAPKTPVTKGSNGVAAATVPNICKMPGPPAPFVPTPLPNIGRSALSPKGYTKNVLVENKQVAIRGASFGSQGDMASKGTGGGLISANTHGPTKFIGPGSLDVKFEGKNVQLLSDPMLNNCGPSGSPANAATLSGVMQMVLALQPDLQKAVNECDQAVNEAWDEENPPGKKHRDCAAHTGELDRKGEPILVQQKLGSLKHDCVYDKLGYGKGKTTGGPSGFENSSVGTELRFNPDGTRTAAGAKWTGTVVPDLVFIDANGRVGAVRDLKFPCPSEAKKNGRWADGQQKKYQKAFPDANLDLIFPR